MTHRLITLVADHFCPHESKEGRRFSLRQAVKFLVIPIGLAIYLPWQFDSVSENARTLILTVVSIAATILTALLAVVQASLSRGDLEPGAGLGSAVERNRLRVILNAISDLNAEVSYTIMVMVLAVLVLAASFLITTPSVILKIMDGFTYFSCATLCLAIVQIVADFYLILDHQVKNLSDRLSRD